MPLGELPAGGVGARKAFGSANAGQLAPGAIHSALIPPGRGSFPAPQRRSGLYVPFLPAPISVLSKYMRSLPQRCLSLQPAFREEPSRLPLRFKAAAQAFSPGAAPLFGGTPVGKRFPTHYGYCTVLPLPCQAGKAGGFPDIPSLALGKAPYSGGRGSPLGKNLPKRAPGY